MKKITTILTSLLLLSYFASAQAPEKISYQAIVRDNSGKALLNTSVGFKVQILKGSSTGTSVYEETNSTLTTNNAGLLTTEIGVGTIVTGSLSAIDWSDGPYYLKAGLDPSGGTNYTLSTVKEITSIPYALYSSNAHSAVHADSTSYADTSSFTSSASFAQTAASADIATRADSAGYTDTAAYALSAPSQPTSLDEAYHVGSTITADKGSVLIGGGDGIMVVGKLASGADLAPVAGNSKMFFYPKKAAIRAGYITGTNWDDDSIANISTAFGANTLATGEYSTALGNTSKSSGVISLAAGLQSVASGSISTALGYQTKATATASTSIGFQTTASGNYATAIGHNTIASGSVSLAMGDSSSAEATYATVIGKNIGLSSKAVGAMYLGDATRTRNEKTVAEDPNTFYARFDNGFRFYTDKSASIGAELLKGQSAWSTLSDSTKKENFLPIDGKAVLHNIGQMTLTTWNYKGQNPKLFRHYGPMAQEFYQHFGHDAIGTIGNDTTINSADMDGILFTAVQALVKENERLHHEIAALNTANKALKTESSSLEKKLVLLEGKVQKILIALSPEPVSQENAKAYSFNTTAEDKH